MSNLLLSVFVCLRAVLKEQGDVALENLALRQQLAVLKRSQTRLKIKQQDRVFWSWLSRTWSGWRATLIIVKPATVIGWHRRGFKLYWTKLSQRRVGGRPAVWPEVRRLIRQMATVNPLWGSTLEFMANYSSWGSTSRNGVCRDCCRGVIGHDHKRGARFSRITSMK